MVLDGTFLKTYETGFLGNVPQKLNDTSYLEDLEVNIFQAINPLSRVESINLN